MFSIIIHLKQNIIIITIQFSSTVSSIPLVELTIHSIIIIFFEFFFCFSRKREKRWFPLFWLLIIFFGGGIQREVIIEERGEKAVYLYASVCVCVYVSVYARARERERDADGVIPVAMVIRAWRHSWLLPPSVLQCGCRNPTSFFLGAFLSPLMKNQHWIQWNWPTMNIPPFFHLFFRFASLFTWLFLSIFLICFLPSPLLSLSLSFYITFLRATSCSISTLYFEVGSSFRFERRTATTKTCF